MTYITTLRNACPYWLSGIPSNWTGFRSKPESPKEPVSPGRATRERPHIDRVITVDPRTPARPTSNTQEAGKATTQQPSVEEVAVDPGSPTGPQSPETDQQPRNEGQEGNDLPVAVISPAVERSDIPVSVSWLNIGLGPKSKCFPFVQPLLHRKRLSEWKHARFWLAYLSPTHVMSVRMVSLQVLVMGG